MESPLEKTFQNVLWSGDAILVQNLLFAAASCHPLSMLPTRVGSPCSGMKHLIPLSILMSDVVSCAGVVIREQKAIGKAKSLELPAQIPIHLVSLGFMEISLACKPGLCPQVNSLKSSDLPRAAPDVSS